MTIPTTNSAIDSARRILEAAQNEAPLARAIQENSPQVDILKLSSFNKQNILRLQLVTYAWRKIGRQVLAMHPEVVEEVRVASSDKVPTEILRALPYLNPMVVFADPPVFESWMTSEQAQNYHGKNETHMRLLGFLTCGIGTGVAQIVGGKTRVEQRIYSTSSTEADRFGVCLVLEPLDEIGNPVGGLEFNTLTMHFDKTLTLAETVDDILSRFHWNDEVATGNVSGLPLSRRSKRWVRELMSVVIGSLFYLCSTTLEAEQVPPKFVSKRMPKRVVRAPMSVYKIGWTTGSALTRLRQQRSNIWKESEQGDITHEQDPQHRRAHFKMQPYGPGRTLRKLIFVSAYWTHIERLGEAGMNIARQVPSLGKGDPGESVKTALGAGQ